MLQERGFWKLNFRIGGRKPPDITPFQNPLSGGSEPGGYVRGVYVHQSWFSSRRCAILWVLSGFATERGILTWGVTSVVMSSHHSDCITARYCVLQPYQSVTFRLNYFLSCVWQLNLLVAKRPMGKWHSRSSCTLLTFSRILICFMFYLALK